MPVMTKIKDELCTHWDTMDIHVNGSYVGTYCMDCNTEFYKRDMEEDHGKTDRPQRDPLPRPVDGGVPTGR